MIGQMVATSQSVEAKAAEVTVPGYWYADPKIFEREREKIWDKSWIFVGREEQLALPGDYLTCTIADEPILITRTHSGKLQAMYNVCPHRGMRLVEGQGNCKQLKCPYHHWIYDLEGQLQGVAYPECFPGLDKSAIALPKVQLDTWGGFIFINLDPKAESLKDYLAGVPQHMEQYSQRWETLRTAHRAIDKVPFNWKILIENYIDAYHIPMVHPQSLAWKFKMPGFVRGCMTGMHAIQEYDIAGPQENTYLACIFPNMTVLTTPKYALVWQVTPINPELTILEQTLCQSPEQMEKFPLETDEQTRSIFAEVFEEDVPFCLTLQQQVKSRAYNPTQPIAQGPEDGVLYFRQALVKAMDCT